MITNSTYLTYAAQIAELFCENEQNKSICQAIVAQRIINSFSNATFENSFLPNLQNGRFYLLRITNITEGMKTKIYFDFQDVITGDYGSDTVESIIPKDLIYSYIPSLLRTKGFNPISENNVYTSGDFMDVRTAWNVNAPTYGIVFVPGNITPPGGGGSGGGGGEPGSGGGGGVITYNTPAQQQQMNLQPAGNGFDLSGLLNNPIVLIAGAALIYFILKD
jgi:hypothetical protein